ncbi:MAG: DUF6308 family protein [Planctomycetota bacterium]|nr:DUF6308 family protein [Planctomycetota bacterium]
MAIPLVFSLDDVTSGIIEDLRDASATFWGDADTEAFDDLIIKPERAKMIAGFIAGSTNPIQFAERLREWLLKPWNSTRTLGKGRMQAVGEALANIRENVAAIPADLSLDHEHADHEMLARMVEMFKQLDDCLGVGPTIASKILAPLRPALFPIWDNPIADAYGFALNAAGYHRYLNVTQAIARKARGFWHSDVSLEQYLKPKRRIWTAPLVKVLDEWNWMRITGKQPYVP